MFDFPVALDRTSELLERIAIALERIAGPIPVYRPPIPSSLKDYSVVTPNDLADLAATKSAFSLSRSVVPDSEAFMKAVLEVEEEVRKEGGEGAVEALPWRAILRRGKVEGGD